jgi:hypothetical protein
VRDQLRAAMERLGLSSDALAHELGLSVSAVQTCAAPHGPVPSDDTIARVQQWLASRDPQNGLRTTVMQSPRAAVLALRDEASVTASPQISVREIAPSSCNGVAVAGIERQTRQPGARTAGFAAEKNSSQAEAAPLEPPSRGRSGCRRMPATAPRRRYGIREIRLRRYQMDIPTTRRAPSRPQG